MLNKGDQMGRFDCIEVCDHDKVALFAVVCPLSYIEVFLHT